MLDMTDRLSTAAGAVYERLEVHRADLGIAELFYGDVVRVGATPTVCVEPSDKARELTGVPRRTSVTLRILVMVYLAEFVGQETTRRSIDEFMDSLEFVLHQDPQYNGLFVHSLCPSIESGYAQRGNTMFQSSRLTFEATSKVSLPLGGV